MTAAANEISEKLGFHIERDKSVELPFEISKLGDWKES